MICRNCKEQARDIRLVPIAHRVHNYQMAKAFQWFFGWTYMLPFVIMSRKRLDSWTWDAVDQAVYRTARVFRGEEMP